MTSTGAAQGAFKGVIDEVRIWNYARSQQSICDSANVQFITLPTDLIGRYELNDVSGTAVIGTGTSGINGTQVNSPPPIAAGSPYNLMCIPPNFAPAQPTAFIPADSLVTTDSVLSATVTDPEADVMKVVFMARRRPAQADSSKFSIISIPDTQFYTSQLNGSTNAMFKSANGMDCKQHCVEQHCLHHSAGRLRAERMQCRQRHRVEAGGYLAKDA